MGIYLACCACKSDTIFQCHYLGLLSHALLTIPVRPLLLQRGLHALGLLREDRRKLLGALGLGWGHPRGEAERAWDARLSELLAFKGEHGHLEVPRGYVPYPQLGAWVARQRRLMAVEGALESACAAQLAAIGMTPLGREVGAAAAASGQN